jgi:aminoacyl tRNA synthase complex-interacting multifunctional protein 1
MTIDSHNLFLAIISAWLPKDDPLREPLSSGTIILENGESYSGPYAVACYICRLRNLPLLGKNELEQMQIQDNVLDCFASDIRWEHLSNILKSKTYMVGAALSLADVALYSKIYYPYSRLSMDDRLTYYHVTRYLDLIQHLVSEQYQDEFVTRIIDIDVDAQVKMGEIKTSKENIKVKKDDKKKSDSPKKISKEKEQPIIAPSQLKIIVGKVVSVKRHPDAEALYVEEVDVGASDLITVVSGLVKFMPEEELLNSLVVLLANLKPAKMRGIESQAMVLTAESEGLVELIRPPPGSIPGDLMTWRGISGNPEPLLNPKKKIWETIQPLLSLSSVCEVVYKDATDQSIHPLGSQKGVCKSKSITCGKIK